MDSLFCLPTATRRHEVIDGWFENRRDELGIMAQRWFNVMRARGEDVWETLHDGLPTACVKDAAFAYVGVFRTHVNVGFFRGANLPDPKGILEGTGKSMRHVKISPNAEPDAAALSILVESAYWDMKRRVGQ